MVFTHKIVCRKSPKLYASYHNQTPQKTCFNLTEKAAFNLPNNTTLLTIEIAVLTVFIPIIPFENIKTLLADNCNSIIIAATISCALLVISIVMMAISFGILMSAVSIQTYSKVDIEKLDLEENLRQDANSVEKGLCDHYKIITLENSDINDRKARKYQLCLPIIIISFFLMTLGTILLKVL